jgi:hypothetical protein
MSSETPAAPVEPGEEGEQAPLGPDGKPATTTSEFTFRTEGQANPWKARILFLVVGLLAGAGGMYYAAWLGVLPGVLY